MTRDEMLRRLTISKNEQVADTAKKILAGKLDPEVVKSYCGSFLRAVLNGDFEHAKSKADSENMRALMNERNEALVPLATDYKGHIIAQVVKGTKEGKFFVPELDSNFYDKERKLFKYFDDVKDVVELIDAITSDVPDFSSN